MQIDRREFIRLAGLLAGAYALPACSDDEKRAVPDAAPVGFDLPTLGGAPSTHEGRVIAAFCDCVVPGAHRDPLGKPGGIDVGAPGMFFDPELLALKYVPLLVLSLDAYAKAQNKGKQFDEIPPDARDAALEAAVQAEDLIDFAIQLAKLAFYSNPAAGAYLGYPGPNPGYWADPDFTFGIALSKETVGPDGNPT